MNLLIIFFKGCINSFLKNFDLKIIRHSLFKPIDLTNKKFYPRSINYYSYNQQVIVKVKLEHGRTSRFFPLSKVSYDPHLFSIVQGLKLKNKNLNQKINENIEISNTLINPKNIIQVLGINKSVNKKLNNFPPWSFVLPWDNLNIEEKIVNFPISVKADRARNGLKINSDNVHDIMKIDKEKSISSHISQYIKLISSVKENGYKANIESKLIEAELLVKENDFRWKIGGEGNHRAVILAALGYQNVEVIVTKMIFYEDSNYWPNVLNKTFTNKEAKSIFNRYYDGIPPAINNKWIKYCNTKND